jgi:hypothetical protein
MIDFNPGSAKAGSPTGSVSAGSPIDPEQYKNLEKVVGTQGQELGEFRQFFADISPLLEKLDKNPELVQAIVEGKLDAELAKAVMDGKVTIGDAKVVSAASAEVKKELGSKAYANASPEDIERLINEKVSAVKDELKGNLKDVEDTRVFEAQVSDFISRTPDFADYAQAIDKWLDSHDITDISVAYYAVKGELSVKEAAKAAQEAEGEAAKGVALNAGGGPSMVTYSGGGADIVDSLISGKSNPNIF